MSVKARSLQENGAAASHREAEGILYVIRQGEQLTMGGLARLIERLADALSPGIEFVLHDFRRMNASVIAVAGDVTGRRVGDPPTDLLLRHLASEAPGDLIRYSAELSDGRQLMSSTIMLRSKSGKPVGAFCINRDVTYWKQVARVADAVLEVKGLPLEESSSEEHFPRSVEELAESILRQSISDVGVPLELMKREHKVRVVEELRNRGLFLMRDAVGTVAGLLGVSRFTIYNYLRELDAPRRSERQR